jgi:hypothetical protein
LISTDHKDIQAMEKAVANPNLMVISDWDRYNYDQYMAAQAASNLDIL